MVKKGSKMSKKSRLKMSHAHLGKKPWNKGKKLSIVYRKKLSEAHKGQISWNKGKHPEYLQGSNNPAWKGGITKQRGYVFIRVPSHPKNHCGYKKRCILVVEKYIERFLKKGEQIHHINGIKDDDRIENLQIVSAAEHVRIHKPRLKKTNLLR